MQIVLTVSIIDSAERERIKNASQRAPQRVAEEIHSGSISNGGHLYSAIRRELSGSGIEMMIAQKLTVWLVQNFSEVVQNVRQGISYAVTAMGTLLSKVSWWQVLAAAVGGIVVGGIACGIAIGLGASEGVAKTIGVGAGVVTFLGILSAFAAALD